MENLYIIHMIFVLHMAMPWLKQLFVSLAALFQSRASQCRFVAGKVALGEVSH
jgi:hypothetical protein